MAAKKKVEKPVTSAQLITVDAGKLSQGLKHTFEGVAMVFDSIGTPVDFGMKCEEEPTAEPDVEPAVSEDKAESKAEPTPVVAEKEAAEPAAPVAEEEKKAQETEVPVVTAPSVSIDDITKIIVQKIKQNRKNNEKIGAILKIYGASKVGELPVDKYEAFLTDLSAI